MSDAIVIACIVAMQLAYGLLMYRLGGCGYRQKNDMLRDERDDARRISNEYQRLAWRQASIADACSVCADSILTCPYGSLEDCGGVVTDFEAVTPDE